MEEALQSAAVAFVVAATIALAASWLAGKLLPASAIHYSAAAAFAAAYIAGSLAVGRWSDLVPARHFHWPLYLALAGAVLGPLAAAANPKRSLAWRWQLLAAVLAAIVLVPHYKALDPPRWVQVPLLAAYLFLLAIGLTALAKRISPPTLIGLCSLSAMTVAATAALASLSFAVGTLIAGGALAGLCLYLWLKPSPEAAQGLALSIALVVGGWAYIGARQSTPCLWGALAAALAPLALWGSTVGPLAQLTGVAKTVTQCALVISALAVAAAWAMLA